MAGPALGTRMGTKTSKDSKGDIGLLIEAPRGKFRGSEGSRKTPEARALF